MIYNFFKLFAMIIAAVAGYFIAISMIVSVVLGLLAIAIMYVSARFLYVQQKDPYSNIS